jgi:hypothetical protein
MTKDEALKMAIEFIEELTKLGGKYPYIDGTGLVRDAYRMNKKLQEALEQSVSCEDIGKEALIDSKVEFSNFLYVSQCKFNGQINISSGPLTPNGERTYDYIGTLTLNKVPKQFKEQPTQEPVAEGLIRQLISIDEHGIETWNEKKFYTHPKEWNGLSKEEIDALGWVDYPMTEDCIEIYKEIEQKLKEKNS